MIFVIIIKSIQDNEIRGDRRIYSKYIKDKQIAENLGLKDRKRQNIGDKNNQYL